MPSPPPLKKGLAASTPLPPPLPVPPPGPGAAPPLVEYRGEGGNTQSEQEDRLKPELQPPELQRTEPERPRRGVKHDLSHLWTAYWFAMGLALAGLLGIFPGVYQIIEHVTHAGDSGGVPRWAYLLVLFGVVQVAYAVYVGQLPDWSVIWMATLFTLLLAAGYATLIGYLMLTAQGVEALSFVQLGEISRHKAVSWCFVMLSANCLLTYLGGRSASGWQRSHATLVAALKRRERANA